MLNYTNQPSTPILSAATLTTTYTDNDYVLAVAGFSKLSLDIDYARGADETTSKLIFKIEHSTDEVNWHSLVIDDTSTVSTLTAREWEIVGTAKLNVILDIAYRSVRISVKEGAVSANAGTATITALTSGL